jgi:hypothetical protein
MNTLSKEFTLGTFFGEDPENYAKLRKQWSKMVNSETKKDLTMYHHILYLVLIGKNWKKAVTLPTNKNKIDNGYKPHIKSVAERWNSSYVSTYTRDMIQGDFDGLVTKEMYDKALKVTNLDMSKDAYNVEE